MRRFVAVLAICLASLLACEGPLGPEGPAGPGGPQGEPGPQGSPGPAGTFAVQVKTATVGEDHAATVVFAGLRVEDVIVNCWTSDDPAGPWIKVGAALDGPVCGAGNNSSGVYVSLLDGVPGWLFLATVAVGTPRT